MTPQSPLSQMHSMLSNAGVKQYHGDSFSPINSTEHNLAIRIVFLIEERDSYKAAAVRNKLVNDSRVDESTIQSKVDRASILDTAKSHVTKDRAATHGDAEKSFETIAGYWNQYFDSRCCDGNVSKLTAYDVSMMMCLFKVARTHNNTSHADNFIDLAGYAACAGEIGCKP